MNEWMNGGMTVTGEKYLAQYHFFLHQTHMDWPGIELMTSQREADDESPEP
jgi:hypothetical protein